MSSGGFAPLNQTVIRGGMWVAFGLEVVLK